MAAEDQHDADVSAPRTINRTWRGRAKARHTDAISTALGAIEQHEDREQVRAHRLNVVKEFEEVTNVTK